MIVFSSPGGDVDQAIIIFPVRVVKVCRKFAMVNPYVVCIFHTDTVVIAAASCRVYLDYVFDFQVFNDYVFNIVAGAGSENT